MTIGEIDYEQISGADDNLAPFVYIMYLIFAFLVAIVLFNLLIAFAVSDLQPLYQHAQYSRLASQLQLINKFEGVMRALACKCLKPSIRRRYLNLAKYMQSIFLRVQLVIFFHRFFLCKFKETIDAHLLDPKLYKRIRGLLRSPKIHHGINHTKAEEESHN